MPLLFLLENGVRVSSAAQPNGVSAVSQNVEGEVPSGDVQGLRRQRDASPTKSAQSTNMVNPEAPGWTNMLRLRCAPPDRIPCPSRLSAFETSIRNYAHQPDKSVVRPAIGLSFDSLDEAYDFYNLYSWKIGFGIRYGKIRLNAQRTKSMHEIVCGCSGKPETENSRSCRCECPALIRLLRSSDNGWYITEHRENHNHSMSLTSDDGEKVHWPSHKHIDVYTKDLIRQLGENNVNLGKVYSIIGSFFGSVEKVPFTKRTLRNICGRISREQADDDVRKTLEVFADIRSNDPGFTYVVLQTIPAR
ncbi:hypothetical protein ZWY2020_013089 [Hordeum vulgare]|nr:hypothetical protein ZWY2020_013089 [Hordeum vulgare]